MKRFFVLFIAALLLTTIMTAQIQRGKKQSAPTKPKTEQKAKPKQSTPSSNSGKSNKTTKKTTKQQSYNRSSSMTQAQKDRIIQQAIDDMVYVEGGTFMMGTEEFGDAVKPVHQVTLSSYYIGKYEVTQALWQAVMGSNPSKYTGDLRRPVEEVSWDECQEFISKLNQLTGRIFRLPTEAEWEYAARGGSQSKGYIYAGSNDIDEVAWYESKNGYTTHPVGRKSPNELGLYDMSGNVEEWCKDWYGSYSKEYQMNPQGPASGPFHVCRGGAWSSRYWTCNVSNRNPNDMRFLYYSVGLRLAM